MRKALIIFAALAVFFVLVPVGANIWKSAFIILNVLPGKHFRPLESVTSAPKVEAVLIPAESGASLKGDVYLPASGRRDKALLVISGASLLGKDDPRIISFGMTMARAGIVVLIPNLTDITFSKLSLGAVDQVALAYKYLLARLSGKKNGMAGFSIATGPMFLASTRPEIRDKVDFLVSFGGYYDIEDILRSDTTIERGKDPTVLPEIRGQFQSYFGHDKTFDALMDNADPSKFDTLYAALTPRIRDFIDTMSIASSASQVGGKRIFLIHSDPDPDVPTEESRKLKAAFGDRAKLTILKSFSHTDIELATVTPMNLVTFYAPEASKLYSVVFAILNY